MTYRQAMQGVQSSDEWNEVRVSGAAIGTMVIRDFLLILMISFAAIQFFGTYQPAGLVALLIGYFLLPGSYREDEMPRAAAAWARMAFGVAIACMLYGILGGGILNLFVMLPTIGVMLVLFLLMETSLGPKIGTVMILFILVIFPIVFGATIFSAFLPQTIDATLAMFLLAVAFFANPPIRKEAVNKTQTFNVYITKGSTARRGVGPTNYTTLVSNGMFLGFAITAVMPLILMFTGATAAAASSIALVNGLILLLSIPMGYFSGPEGRPYMGIIVLVFAMMAFSFVYTGAVGTAIFGGFWPQVNTVITAVATPMGDAFSAVGQTMSDTKLLMTCPSCYYDLQLQKQKAANSKVVEGGTVKSIEMMGFKAINWAEGVSELDPSIPLIGSVKLENQGCFTAHNLNVKLLDPILLNPEKVSAAKPTQGYEVISDKCTFTECLGADDTSDESSCQWYKKRPNIPPGDLKLMTFQCGDPSSGEEYQNWSTDVQKCDCYNSTSQNAVYEKGVCDKDICSQGGGDLLTYSYADWMVTIPLRYEFNYSSNVSMDSVQVMDADVFNQKLLNDEVSLENRESIYSGGPVKISIYVQDQPLRSGERSYGTLSITNTGKGNVSMGTELHLWLPSSLTGIQLTSMRQVGKASGLTCTPSSDKDIIQYNKTVCLLTNDLASGETRTYAFSFTYVLSGGVDTKTLGFRGTVDYDYVTVSQIQIPITKFPLTG